MTVDQSVDLLVGHGPIRGVEEEVVSWEPPRRTGGAWSVERDLEDLAAA